jgi:hypothetical protein
MVLYSLNVCVVLKIHSFFITRNSISFLFFFFFFGSTEVWTQGLTLEPLPSLKIDTWTSIQQQGVGIREQGLEGWLDHKEWLVPLPPRCTQELRLREAPSPLSEAASPSILNLPACRTWEVNVFTHGLWHFCSRSPNGLNAWSFFSSTVNVLPVVRGSGRCECCFLSCILF